MTNNELKKIIAEADMIVCGYAFTETTEENVCIVGLDAPNHALLMSSDGEVLETNMTDIEIDIVIDYWHRNQQFLKAV